MGAPPWSATRARTFQSCRRKYFFRYHLAPLARRPDAPPDSVEADRVKDLVGLEAWVGDLVHGVLQQAFHRWRAGREFPEEEAVTLAGRLLSRQFRSSRDYWSAPPEQYPRRPVLLDLHYYPADLSRERAAELKERVSTCIRSFLRSDLVRRIRAVGPRRWLPIERHAAARLEGGVLVLVKPDFAFEEDGRLHILDWKTGRPDPFWEMVQVTCYALYAAEKWRRRLDRIVPQIVYLSPAFRLAKTEYGPESVNDVLEYIAESQQEILSLLDGDGLPPADRFPFAEDCRSCRWCQFRGICEGADREGAGRLPAEELE